MKWPRKVLRSVHLFALGESSNYWVFVEPIHVTKGSTHNLREWRFLICMILYIGIWTLGCHFPFPKRKFSIGWGLHLLNCTRIQWPLSRPSNFFMCIWIQCQPFIYSFEYSICYVVRWETKTNWVSLKQSTFFFGDIHRLNSRIWR